MATNRPVRAVQNPGTGRVLGEANGANVEKAKNNAKAPAKKRKGQTTAVIPTVAQNQIPKALAIPELLDLIFSYLKREDKALRSCALVCRAWTEAALNYLWAEMSSVVPLLQLLAPMEITSSQQRVNNWRFNGSLRIAKTTWERYRWYAMRVRSLSYNDRGSWDQSHIPSPYWVTVVPAKELTTMASKCPFEDGLLPNCRKIVWAPTWKYTVGGLAALLHPSLSELVFGSWSMMMSDLLPLFSVIPERAKNLKSMTFITEGDAFLYEAPLVRCLESLPFLEEVLLPPWAQTSAVVEAASELPALRRFDVRWEAPFWRFLPSAIGMKFNFPGNGFRSLNSLGVTMELAELRLMLEGVASPVANLTVLTVWDRTNNTAAIIQHFLDIIPNAFPNLEEASFVLFGSALGRHNKTVMFDTLRPLLRCKSIKDLYMGHDAALAITKDDVREMATVWPNLQYLDLCKDPYPRGFISYRDVLGTSIEILETVAECIPNLRQLGLHFSPWPEPRYDGNLCRTQAPFKGDLRVGTSDVPGDGAATGFYLAAVLHDEVKINAYRSVWREEFDSNPLDEDSEDEDDDDDGDRISRWETVSGIVKMAHRTRRLMLKSTE